MPRISGKKKYEELKKLHWKKQNFSDKNISFILLTKVL